MTGARFSLQGLVACLIAATVIVGSNFSAYVYAQVNNNGTLHLCNIVRGGTPDRVTVSVTGTTSRQFTTAANACEDQSLSPGSISVTAIAAGTVLNAVSSNTCNIDIVANQESDCNLIIDIGGTSGGSVNVNTRASQSGFNAAPSTPGPLVNTAAKEGEQQQGGAGGSATKGANGLGPADSPLNSCAATQVNNDLTSTGQLIGSNILTGNDLFLTPSSATYSIRGSASIGKIVNSLKNPNDDFTIQIFADFNRDDMITLAMADPPLAGRILIGTDLKPIDTIPYNIKDIRTSCDFITLIKPNSNSILTGKAPIYPNDKKSSPSVSLDKLGQINQPATKNELLVGGGGANGAFVVNPNNPGEIVQSIVVNPPFRSCAKNVGSTSVGGVDAQLGRYDIRGSAPDLKKLDMGGKHTVEVRMVSDLVISPRDLAEIIKNNNSFVKISLWIDPGTSSAKDIPFTIEEISSHCQSVGFTSNPQIS